jgi:hypothetical protein
MHYEERHNILDKPTASNLTDITRSDRNGRGGEERRSRREHMTSGRMVSSGMLRRVALVRTEVLEELSASIITVTTIGGLRTLAVTCN